MLTFWEPLRELDSLRRDFDRAFENVLTQGRRNSFLPGRHPRSYPLVNISEDNDAIHVEALAPGIDPDQLQINVVRNQLTISGEKVATNGQVSAENHHRTERAGGRFTRSFTLPSEVDPDNVTAEYRAGILRLALPKTEAAKPRRIEVSVA